MKQLGRMLKRVFVSVLIGAVGVVAVVGCGGSGGANHGNSATQGSITRQMQPGDRLSYSVTGFAREGRENYSVSGTATVQTYNGFRTPMYGMRTLKQVTRVSVTVNGRTVLLNCVDLLEQDADGNVYCVGYERGDTSGALERASSPPVLFPSKCSLFTYWGYRAEWRDTCLDYMDCGIHEQESIAGYQAYGVFVDELLGDMILREERYWFVPEIGYPVKSTITITQDDDRYLLTMTLTEKSF